MAFSLFTSLERASGQVDGSNLLQCDNSLNDLPSDLRSGWIPGRSKRHFAPGLKSSSLRVLIGFNLSKAPALSSSFRILEISLASAIDAAAKGITFLKNDLSSTFIDRFTGGRKISGSSVEFILSDFRYARPVENSRRV